MPPAWIRWFCAALCAAVLSPPLAALTLPDALERLRAEGIETVYTERLVSDDFAVDAWPTGGGPEQRLRALLTPFGLAAKPTDAGGFVIVRLRTGAVEGCLRSDPGGQPISGADVWIDDGALRGKTHVEGCYRLLGVPQGERRLHVARPGFLGRELAVTIAPGGVHRRDLRLPVDAQISETVFVSTTPEEPPLGGKTLRRRRLEDARRSEPDLLSAVARATEATGEIGAGLSIRGRSSEQITVVVDGVELVEPYHLRNLGKLGSTVTPGAVDRVEVHRGQPPLAYGASAGGVVEMLTEAPNGRFSGRVGATSGARSFDLESSQVAVHGAAAQGRLRGLAAHRTGQPVLPPEIGKEDQKPEFDDTLLKLSGAVTDRWDVHAQFVGADDSYSRSFTSLHGFDGTVFSVGQGGRHYGLRSLLTLGEGHVLEVILADVGVERWRWLLDQGSDLVSVGGEITPDDYLINDRRDTERQVARLVGKSSFGPRFELIWGGESGRERTAYDYVGFSFGASRVETTARFRPQERITDTFDLADRYTSGFVQATWRAAENLKFDAGLRLDRGALSEETSWAPRASLAYSGGGGVWRAAYAEAASRAPTDALAISDGSYQEFRPRPQSSRHLAVGYVRQTATSLFSAELYSQRIDDPFRRFINLYKPISSVLELEL
ncbi:MAG: TonB-dependent receptor, partial [Acidobacteriota bacterium]